MQVQKSEENHIVPRQIFRITVASQVGILCCMILLWDLQIILLNTDIFKKTTKNFTCLQKSTQLSKSEDSTRWMRNQVGFKFKVAKYPHETSKYCGL